LTRAIKKVADLGKAALSKIATAASNVANSIGSAISGAVGSIEHQIHKLGNMNISHTQKITEITLAAKELKFLDDLITVSASIKVVPSFMIKVEIADFKLKRFEVDLIGTVTGDINAKFNAGKSVSKTFEIFSIVSPALNIPTPVPGLFVSVVAVGGLDATLAASFSIKADLGQITATGELGAEVDWVAGSGFSHSTRKNFTLVMNPPKLTEATASLSLEISPSFGLRVGASVVGLIRLEAGPVVSFPVKLTLTANLLKACLLELVGTWEAQLHLGIDLAFLSKDLLKTETGAIKLADGKFLDKCLLDNPVVTTAAPTGKGFFGAPGAKKSYKKRKY